MWQFTCCRLCRRALKLDDWMIPGPCMSGSLWWPVARESCPGAWEFIGFSEFPSIFNVFKSFWGFASFCNWFSLISIGSYGVPLFLKHLFRCFSLIAYIFIDFFMFSKKHQKASKWKKKGAGGFIGCVASILAIQNSMWVLFGFGMFFVFWGKNKFGRQPVRA